MSRILRRPMFRKGGQVMDGVMSLASGGRAKYQEAGRVSIEDLTRDDPYLKEIYDIAQAGYGRDIQQERSDVLANLLIRGGLGLVAGEGAGKGTLGAIATAFQKPTEQALTEMSALKQDPAKMLVAKTAIEQKGQERLKRIENEGKVLGLKNDAVEIIQKTQELDLPAAERYYDFQQKQNDIARAQGLPIGSRGGRLYGVEKKGQVDYSTELKNRAPGVYFDPDRGNYVRYEGGVATILDDPLKPYTPKTISTESQKKLFVPEYNVGDNVDPNDPFSGGMVP